MAILGKIRKQTGLLIGVTAFGLLAFLVPWNSVSDFFLGTKNPNVFGNVNGSSITREEYYGQLGLFNAQFQGQTSKEILEGENWNSLVINKIIEQKFDAAGFTLTDDMIWDRAKYFPMLANDPRFLDKNGKFSVSLIKEEFENLEKNYDNVPQENYQIMMSLKKNLAYQAMYNQYAGAYSTGLLANSKEVDIQAQNQVNLANIDYVKIDYNAYQKLHPVQVTDEDLQAYIEKHKTLFKIDENRTLDYVFFSGKPTASDEQQTLNSLNKLLSTSIIDGDTIQAFGSVKNDSLYINELRNAQIVDNTFIPQYRYEKQLPPAIEGWTKSASIGQISPAYKESGYYIVSKLIGKKTSDSIKAKSILISFAGANAQIQLKKNRTKEQAQKQAEELVTQLTANPNDFVKLGTELSDDPGFAQNQGSIELTTAQEIPFKPLQDFFNGASKGKIGMVETPNGYMVIQVLERKPDAVVYKLADLAKEIKPSEETTELARKQATNFIQSISGKSSKEFQEAAKKQNYNPVQQSGIVRYGSALNIRTDKDSEIIAWAFNPERKLGDTNKFVTGDESQVVVRVSSLFKKGLMHPSLIRKQYETIVRNEKLAKIIAEKINSSKKSLDQLASEYKTTKNSASVNFTNPVIDGSFEPKVGGASFGLKQGGTSNAIEGKSGVYVITSKSITKGEVGDKKELKSNLMKAYAQQIPALFMNTLFQKAKIDDYRGSIMDQPVNE